MKCTKHSCENAPCLAEKSLAPTEENKIFSGRIGRPRVAVCPECGEVSVYLEDVSRLRG
ncbi:MAG: nucleic acid-binding protein [Oscillospiraceae bacterium]|nr:nucleic acid-binding protein [Oscillospiraceae bacterium]